MADDEQRNEPNDSRMTTREAVVFWLKLAGFLAALFAFGGLIYWLRRQIGH